MSKDRSDAGLEELERRVAWWDATMDASSWWQAESIPAVSAAMLLCRFNPNTETPEDAEKSSSDELNPQDYRRLKQLFEGAADQAKTLNQWFEYAESRGLRVHSWFKTWMVAKDYTNPGFFKPGTVPPLAHSRLSTCDTVSAVSSEELLEKFHLDNAEWQNKLRHVDKYKLTSALVQRGRRGKGGRHMWNPAKFALILLERKERTESALTTNIERKFPAWADEWHETVNWAK